MRCLIVATFLLASMSFGNGLLDGKYYSFQDGEDVWFEGKGWSEKSLSAGFLALSNPKSPWVAQTTDNACLANVARLAHGMVAAGSTLKSIQIEDRIQSGKKVWSVGLTFAGDGHFNEDCERR